jgi:hypothetical protein
LATPVCCIVSATLTGAVLVTCAVTGGLVQVAAVLAVTSAQATG